MSNIMEPLKNMFQRNNEGNESQLFLIEYRKSWNNFLVNRLLICVEKNIGIHIHEKIWSKNI